MRPRAGTIRDIDRMHQTGQRCRPRDNHPRIGGQRRRGLGRDGEATTLQGSGKPTNFFRMYHGCYVN